MLPFKQKTAFSMSLTAFVISLLGMLVNRAPAARDLRRFLNLLKRELCCNFVPVKLLILLYTLIG